MEDTLTDRISYEQWAAKYSGAAASPFPIGECLRRWRAYRGMRMVDAAHCAGINPHSLRAIESGAKQPTMNHLQRLSALYIVPMDELFSLPRAGA